MNNNIKLPAVPGIPVGEIKVWISGLGVSIGLLMIFGFLGIIVYNGLGAFWSKNVYAFSVSFGENEAPVVYYASIAKDVEKRNNAAGAPVSEYQVFTGNKDIYGQSFRYIDKSSIVSMTEDDSLIELERLQGGRSIVKPLYLEAGSKKISAGSDDFHFEMKRLMSEGQEIREKITHLQKRDIGKINSDLERHNRDIKALELSYDFVTENGEHTAVLKESWIVKDSDPVASRDGLLRKIRDLKKRYEVYMSHIDQLQLMRGKGVLHYEAGDGVARQIEVDDVLGYIEPGKLGFFRKTGIFFGRVFDFLTENPREANTEGGIYPAIFGTFFMTVLMSLLVTPIGVLAAVYLREYARQGPLVRVVRICVNNLAGVPSIVFGVFGLGFFVYFLGGTIDQLFFSKNLAVSQSPTFGTSGVLWASLTLALMTLPVVIVSTEEALNSVPRGLREAALACGASKWQMIQRIILPKAMPGILTGIILAMARGAGEVAPLMLTGVVKLAPDLPIDFDFPFVHLERKFMHMGFHIYDVAFQSPDSDAARDMVFATALFLILLVVVMNLVAILIRNNLRKKHQQSSF